MSKESFQPYFKTDATQAYQELKAWAEKNLAQHVRLMLVFDLPTRSGTITFAPEPMTRAERLRMVQSAVNAITSQADDADHREIK